jgi:8-oxo-dGTP pyrophosphatase MutT (NUDIX family)
MIERAAARYFGIVTHAAHVNGLVAHHGELGMWLARRSATKAIDPGQLDTLVGGGVRAGTTVAETVRREAWEEAGITSSVAARAQPVGVLRICRAQPDGLQREIIHAHDLRLPGDYTPSGHDGEVVAHRLVTATEAATVITNESGDDLVTADASLVILDCLFRHGLIAPDATSCVALAGLRWSPAAPPGARSTA